MTPESEHSLPLMAPELIHPYDSRGLARIHAFLEQEAVSAGGNISDKTFEDIVSLARSGTQLWTMQQNNEIVSLCTLEPLEGTSFPWWYLNNGVTKKEHRRSGLSSALVANAMERNGGRVGYVVIYIRQGIFERLGFTETDVTSLRAIDASISARMAQKLRPNTESHLFVRLPVSTW